MSYIFIQLEYLIKLLGAAACGMAVGYERENHLKTAGIRTHTIVALASSAMMIISKYGFEDVLRANYVRLDPSRIAAGVVTAIGFLGVGIIYTRNLTVSGLTTAAGIWATVGIGMAFGAGMYGLGVLTTLCIIIIQFILHRNFRWLKTLSIQQVTMEVGDADNFKQILEDSFAVKHLKILTMKVTRVDEATLKIKLSVAFPDDYTYQDVIDLLKENPQIKSVDI